MRRVVLLVSLLAIGPFLANCSNFDPDSLDVFGLNEKKKLPGERKDLFPGGVPGVTQGIPPEYMKGNQAEQTGAAINNSLPPPAEANSKTAAAEQAAEEKPKPKPKPRARTASRPPARVTVQQPSSAQQPPPSAEPWPAPQQQQTQQEPAGQAPWPAPAAGQASSSAPWPSAPAPGTFSKQ
jgi:hypothetical protein